MSNNKDSDYWKVSAGIAFGVMAAALAYYKGQQNPIQEAPAKLKKITREEKNPNAVLKQVTNNIKLDEEEKREANQIRERVCLATENSH